MSYVDTIPPDELKQYEIIEDWGTYLDNTYKDRENRFGRMESLWALSLERKIFKSDVSFIGGNYKHSIRFEKCFFQKGLNFVNGTFDNTVSISECFIDGHFSAGMYSNFNNNFHVFNTTAKSFTIIKASFKHCIWNIGCEKVSLLECRCEEAVIMLLSDLSEMNISCTNSSGVIKVIDNHHHSINRIGINGPSTGVSLELQNLNVDKLVIENFRNDNGFRISGVRPISADNEFIVGDSNMGKAEFYDIDFTKYHKVSFYNSFIADSIFVNISFPDNIDLFKSSPDKEETQFYHKILTHEHRIKGIKHPRYDQPTRVYYAKKREMLRQFKFALGKQGDTVNEQRFHSLEVRAFDRSLTWKKNGWTKLII